MNDRTAAQDLAHELLGTVDDWPEDTPQGVLLELDTMIWRCAGCEWWVELCDIEEDEAGRGYCTECRENKE